MKHLMVNTQLTPDGPINSGWYIVNWGVNGGQTLGSIDSRYPKDIALRNFREDHLTEEQRVVGVYGHTRLANGELRSIGLIIAHIDHE